MDDGAIRPVEDEQARLASLGRLLRDQRLWKVKVEIRHQHRGTLAAK
jgi:hypothetical protein